MFDMFSTVSNDEIPVNPYIEDDYSRTENGNKEESLHFTDNGNNKLEDFGVGNDNNPPHDINYQNKNPNFMDMINGNDNPHPSLPNTQSVGYSFRDNFHTVVEGKRREEEDHNDNNFYDENDTKDVILEKSNNAKYSRSVTDPHNSLLSFLSILSAQLNVPFDSMTTDAGLPTPKIQGMLEIARNYLKEWTKLRKIGLNHIIYDDGENGNLRVKFAELISRLLYKESGGSAYGKMITPSNGGSLSFYTSADHRSKKINRMILIGFRRYFKSMYWIRNPKITRLKREKTALERGNSTDNKKKLDAVQWEIDELTRVMPKVLALNC